MWFCYLVYFLFTFLPFLGDIFQLLSSIRVFFVVVLHCFSPLPHAHPHRCCHRPLNFCFYLMNTYILSLHQHIHTILKHHPPFFFSPSWHCLSFLWVSVFCLFWFVFDVSSFFLELWPPLGWWLKSKAQWNCWKIAKARLALWRSVLWPRGPGVWLCLGIFLWGSWCLLLETANPPPRGRGREGSFLLLRSSGRAGGRPV